MTRNTYFGAMFKQPFFVVKGVLVILLVVGSFAASGQYVSRLGRFQVDQIKGCAPFTVNITATNLKPGHDCGTSTCQMTFEPGVSIQNTFSYQYLTPGTYTMMVLYPSTIGEAADDITITVLPNVKPDFEVYTCSNNGVSINIIDKTYDQYFIDFGDASAIVGIPSGNSQVAQHSYSGSGSYNISVHGRKLGAADNCDPMVKNFNAIVTLPAPFVNKVTAVDASNIQIDFTAAVNLELHLEIAVNNASTFQLYKVLYGVGASAATNLKVDENFYCFRVSAYDPCTGVETPSNAVCSLKFATSTQSDVDKLAWTTAGAPTNFSINRDGSLYGTTPATSYDDVDIDCNTKYCYQIISNYPGGSTSVSLSSCVTSFSTKVPFRIENTSGVVSATGVALTWLQSPAFIAKQYNILRRSNSDAYQAYDVSSTTSYSDVSYTTDGNYCYVINYTDHCNNNSAMGLPVCPIRLLGTLDKSNMIHLSWNNFKGWLNGASGYTLQRFDQAGNLTKTVALGLDTTYVDSQVDTLNQKVSYIVTAAATDAGLTSSVSNVASFIKEANLYYPTAFTPDRNNRNETFTVRGFFITHLELRIFNRWGNMIFSTSTNQPWDGTFNGKVQPNDTYVWTASVTDLAGQNFSHSGTVVLLTPDK